MNLLLQREPSTVKSTPGVLFVDGLRECFILEDVCRDIHGNPVIDGHGIPITEDSIRGVPVEQWKVNGKTAIPAGRFKVIVNRSERFSQRASRRAGHPVDVFLPLLVAVPGFSGVRIHGGNDADDSEACLLTGEARSGRDRVVYSQAALDRLLRLLRAALACKEEIWIEVRNAPLPTQAEEVAA